MKLRPVLPGGRTQQLALQHPYGQVSPHHTLTQDTHTSSVNVYRWRYSLAVLFRNVHPLWFSECVWYARSHWGSWLVILLESQPVIIHAADGRVQQISRLAMSLQFSAPLAYLLFNSSPEITTAQMAHLRPRQKNRIMCSLWEGGVMEECWLYCCLANLETDEVKSGEIHHQNWGTRTMQIKACQVYAISLRKNVMLIYAVPVSLTWRQHEVAITEQDLITFMSHIDFIQCILCKQNQNNV